METSDNRLCYLGNVTSFEDNQVRWQYNLVGTPTKFFHSSEVLAIHHPFLLKWKTNDGHQASAVTLAGEWCHHDKYPEAIDVTLSFPLLPDDVVQSISDREMPCLTLIHDRPVLSIIRPGSEAKSAMPAHEPSAFSLQLKGIVYADLMACIDSGGVE